MKTNWGYIIEDGHDMDILTLEEFNEMTGGKYEDDTRTEAMLRAAEDAIRNYCGWHVSPALPCIFDSRLVDLGLSLSGSDLLIELPARFIDSVKSVEINGQEYTEFYESSGLLTVFDVYDSIDRRTPVRVEYTAGGDFAAVKDIVMHRVDHALANTSGIMSETTGSESVTYNVNWINNARATGLADDNKDVLNPYRLAGVI